MLEAPQSSPVPPPRGIYATKCDEKGRLKLPANFQEFLGTEKLFVTSLDGRIARIYPISVWLENEILLASQTDDPDTAEDVSFIANKNGADAEIDGQGRVLLPTDLRRDLGLENSTVWVDYFSGGLNVYSKAVYEERERRAKQDQVEKLKKMRMKGLK